MFSLISIIIKVEALEHSAVLLWLTCSKLYAVLNFQDQRHFGMNCALENLLSSLKTDFFMANALSTPSPGYCNIYNPSRHCVPRERASDYF